MIYMPCVRYVKRGDGLAHCGEKMTIKDGKAHCPKHGIANQNGCGSKECVDKDTLEIQCKNGSCEWSIAFFEKRHKIA